MTANVGRRVWKFPLDPHLHDACGKVTDRPVIPMPRGAQILTVQMQDGRPMVWALVDASQPTERRRLFIVGTGELVPPTAETYIGTWQSGPFVFHLFEEGA